MINSRTYGQFGVGKRMKRDKERIHPRSEIQLNGNISNNGKPLAAFSKRSTGYVQAPVSFSPDSLQRLSGRMQHSGRPFDCRHTKI